MLKKHATPTTPSSFPVATLRTAANGTASVSYAPLGRVPGFEFAPYTYLSTLHLDAPRQQMIGSLVGLQDPPPAAGPRRRRGSRVVGDPGDLFFVVADVAPATGAVAKVWLDLSEWDLRLGGGAITGVSAWDGAVYWTNAIAGQVPSGQAIYGFPRNGSAPIVIP